VLVLDTSLLSDYLEGHSAAMLFLDDYEAEQWAVPAVACSEAFMASVHGYVDADVPAVRTAIESSMQVLDVTMRTATEAATLQRALMERGCPAEQLDALLAASAIEHGATFATADEFFWADPVQEVVPVAEYDRDGGGASA